MTLRVLSTLAILATPFMWACNSSPSTAQSNASATRTQTHVRLRCEQRTTLLECRALASDDGSSETTDVTDRVRWTADTSAVIVEEGRIRPDSGGVATVSAMLMGAAGSPSGSIAVIADARTGETRQAYVLEGQVRQFPSAEGIGGAFVSLISEGGVAQSVTTGSHGESPGQFRFIAVARGTYQLRAVHDGFRATEIRVVVPDDMPRTVTLLPEPRSRIPIGAN
ncbi:MAG TPA: carboxypeptidase-like regulatory domain-containing protein [Vicinamibacterales bacterium]|nr:carboxypeptidase-like regulatory domain-containing protein [Vicinamibacterales bacterium]